jgi:phosphate transport system protein
MVKFIESELVLLRKEIDEMWTLVYSQLDRAGEAVLTLDKELARQVVVREKRVNAFELKIDSDVEDIIALYNPVAIDLRFVLAMLKINTNLERLGSLQRSTKRAIPRRRFMRWSRGIAGTRARITEITSILFEMRIMVR